MADEKPSIFSPTTIVSLLAVASILGAAWIASNVLLPKAASTKTRLFFVWHAFDGLVHFILEGSYLYNCFFSYTTLDGLWRKDGLAASPYLPPNIHFLAHKDRMYGAQYATPGSISHGFATLWMEYARADKRWAGSDLTIISLELLTVFIAGPLAIYICNCLRKEKSDVWFWMIVLATGELYGGFMTFAPEWLSGNVNLDGSDPILLWVYLVFFNAALWVVIPLWVLYESYGKIVGALRQQKLVQDGRKAR